MKYRKKPVVIDAVQFMGGHVSMLECAAFVGDAAVQNLHDATLKIRTLEGVMDVTPEDYIIRGVKGECYPCKPDIFSLTYEPADEPPHAGGELQVGIPLVASVMGAAGGERTCENCRHRYVSTLPGSEPVCTEEYINAGNDGGSIPCNWIGNFCGAFAPREGA